MHGLLYCWTLQRSQDNHTKNRSGGRVKNPPLLFRVDKRNKVVLLSWCRRASKLEAQAKAQAKNGLGAQATDYPDVDDTDSNYPDYPDDQGNPLALAATETSANLIKTLKYAFLQPPPL